MKSENNEVMVKWITITILVAISVFFGILYQTSQKPKTSQADEEPKIVDQNNNNDNNAADDNNNDDDNPYVGPTIEYTTFPKNAYTSSNGEFFINTGGEGDDKLKDVIDFNNNYYLILETNSNSNDYVADRNYIAIAKLDYNGTILATLTIESNRNDHYLASKISNNGILIVAYNDSGINYYMVSFSLEYSKAVTTDDYDSIKLFYTRDYTLAVGCKGNNITFMGIDDNLNKLFTNTIEFDGTTSVDEILPALYGYSFVISIGGTNSHSRIISINPSGNILANEILTSDNLIKVCPVANGYALLELSGQTLYLKVLDFNLTQQFKTHLGDGIGGDFFPVSNGYLVLIYTSGDTIAKHLCSYGQVITYNDMDFRNIRKVNSFAIVDDGIYIYTDIVTLGDTLDTRVLKYNNNNIITYTQEIGGYYQDNSVRIIIEEDQIITFMNTYSNTGDYITSYGGIDIFIHANNINN